MGPPARVPPARKLRGPNASSRPPILPFAQLLASASNGASPFAPPQGVLAFLTEAGAYPFPAPSGGGSGGTASGSAPPSGPLSAQQQQQPRLASPSLPEGVILPAR